MAGGQRTVSPRRFLRAADQRRTQGAAHLDSIWSSQTAGNGLSAAEAERWYDGLAACRTRAAMTEGMVQPVRGDHQGAAGKGDADLVRVRRQPVTEPGRPCNAAEPAQHQCENGKSAVPSKTGDERDGAEERNQHGKAAVRDLFPWQQMCQHRRKGQQHGGKQAVHHAQGRSPHAQPVDKAAGSSGGKDRSGSHPVRLLRLAMHLQEDV